MRFITSVLLLIAAYLSFPAFAAEPAASSATLSTIATQLGKAIKQDVIWQAPYGATVNIEAEPQPITLDEFTNLIDKLNKRMSREHPELVPFVVCIFTNAIVVRTVAQPECDKPLK